MEDVSEKPEYTVLLWSGGKDSSASIILAHEHGVKIDEIIISMPMFDKSRGIYADHPAHVKWLLEYGIPRVESFGYTVKVLTGKNDYIYYFNNVLSEKARQDRIGKKQGFLIPGRCRMNGEKFDVVNKRIKELSRKYRVLKIEGIAADEAERIIRMTKNRGSQSLLAEYGVEENDTYAICRRYGLLSPLYDMGFARQGCWFCPNTRIPELAELKHDYREIYHELEILADEKDTVNDKLLRGITWAETERLVNLYLASPKTIRMEF